MSQTWVLTEDEGLELLAFLITAARTQVDEAAEYGPMRLVMAAERLARVIAARASAPTRQFLARTLDGTSTLAAPISDPEGYSQGLDALCSELAAHLEAHFRGESAMR